MRLHKVTEKDKVLSLHRKNSKSGFLWSRARNRNSLKDSLCYEIELPRVNPFQNGTAYLICWLRDLSLHRVLETSFGVQNIPRLLPTLIIRCFQMQIIIRRTYYFFFFFISIRSLQLNQCLLQNNSPHRTFCCLSPISRHTSISGQSHHSILPLWRCDSTRAMAFSFIRFLDHTQRRITSR